MNVCILGGYVAAKPEVKVTTANTTVTKFDIAVPRSYKNKEGKRDYDYFALEAWGQTAELIGRYYDKKSWIAVRAEARVDKWADQNGQNRYKTVFRVEEVFFGGGSRTAEGGTAVNGNTAVTPSMYGAGTDTPPMTGYVPDGYAQSGAGYEEVSDDGDLPF